jgi:signal transduction histidine kinase
VWAHSRLQAIEEHLRDFLDGGAHTDGTDRQAEKALRTVQAQLPVARRELRDLARGYAPGVLAASGLRAAVVAMTETLPLPVRLDLPDGRFDRDTENAAYFMISEVLANAVRHADATKARVDGTVDGTRLLVSVADDGVGGAEPAGHGLAGIAERVGACGGRLTVDSAPGQGTRVIADLPA